MFGLMIYDFGGTSQGDVAFGNKASIVETRINNRIQPIHFGVNYHSKPLEFKLVFGSEKPLDRFDLEQVSLWLTGHNDYEWLTIGQGDLDRVQYRCIITSLTPLTHGWLPVAFEANVLCDCPYAYSRRFSQSYTISGSKTILFRNDSSVREYLKPELTIAPTSSSFKIVNHSDNDREFSFDGIPTGGSITVDNNNGIITHSDGVNLYDKFNLNFFRLVNGANKLEVTGSGTLTIAGRFLYNVAG